MRTQLTPKLLDSLKPATGKRYEVRDTLLAGLLVRVSKRGSKIWYVMPRVTGKPKRIKIGSYPILSLADAREKARSLLRDAQLGLLTETAIKAEAAKLAKLEMIIPQFIELYAKPRNRDWQETSRLLTKFKPLYGRPIGEIKRAEVVHIVDELAKRSPYRANRALQSIKKLYNWCVDRGTVEFSPVAGLKPPTKEIARDRVLSDPELSACWHAAIAEGFPFAQFIQLVILTQQTGHSSSSRSISRASGRTPMIRRLPNTLSASTGRRPLSHTKPSGSRAHSRTRTSFASCAIKPLSTS